MVITCLNYLFFNSPRKPFPFSTEMFSCVCDNCMMAAQTGGQWYLPHPLPMNAARAIQNLRMHSPRHSGQSMLFSGQTYQPQPTQYYQPQDTRYPTRPLTASHGIAWTAPQYNPIQYQPLMQWQPPVQYAPSFLHYQTQYFPPFQNQPLPMQYTPPIQWQPLPMQYGPSIKWNVQGQHDHPPQHDQHFQSLLSAPYNPPEQSLIWQQPPPYQAPQLPPIAPTRTRRSQIRGTSLLTGLSPEVLRSSQRYVEIAQKVRATLADIPLNQIPQNQRPRTHAKAKRARFSRVEKAKMAAAKTRPVPESQAAKMVMFTRPAKETAGGSNKENEGETRGSARRLKEQKEVEAKERRRLLIQEAFGIQAQTDATPPRRIKEEEPDNDKGLNRIPERETDKIVSQRIKEEKRDDEGGLGQIPERSNEDMLDEIVKVKKELQSMACTGRMRCKKQKSSIVLSTSP
ncbi:hypothetical protein BDZ45DRAFT_148625 [Acephala macrosclerotiorum]|nr:hypothetical protein BDZ45DRAFT_148625 [Acephala macrosclerotiorum]